MWHADQLAVSWELQALYGGPGECVGEQLAHGDSAAEALRKAPGWIVSGGGAGRGQQLFEADTERRAYFEEHPEGGIGAASLEVGEGGPGHAAPFGETLLGEALQFAKLSEVVGEVASGLFQHRWAPCCW